jgi:hypothetical protein
MTALKFEGFMGLMPRYSARLLPNMAATTARNIKLLSGEARGFRVPREVKDLTDRNFTVRRAYRIEYDEYGETHEVWLAFDSRDVDIVRSPLVNDAHNRYYWAGDGAPKYNTLDRIIADQPPLKLGIPPPATMANVTPPGAGTDTTRSYVYTFVSAYGEEGPPSDPSPPQTAAAGTWTLSGLDTTPADASERNITAKRIYRTVPGNSSTSFFFVAEIPLGDTTYNDTAADDVVALNNLLESTSWFPPEGSMEGFVAMPNGYLVGWKGRRLMFSEPYRPHAWPPEYEIGVEFEIVGLAVWGNVLIIGTRSNPYLGMGVSPAAFTTQKTNSVTPCLSRRGMVSSDAGVYYPSLNGIVLVDGPTPRVITHDLVTKEEWLRRYNPENFYAACYGMQYIAFNSPSFGLVFNPSEPTARLVELDRFIGVEGIETDPYNGLVYLIDQDRVYEFDPENSERAYWRWKSKEFHLPKPVNFAAAKIKFDFAPVDVSLDVLEHYVPYNTARFAAGPLGTLNGHVINGVQGKGQVPTWPEPENRMPLAGSPLIPITPLLMSLSAVRFIVYANGEKVFDRMVTDQELIRLPTGFKRDVWQFEMVSNSNVYSLHVAETGKELAGV